MLYGEENHRFPNATPRIAGKKIKSGSIIYTPTLKSEAHSSIFQALPQPRSSAFDALVGDRSMAHRPAFGQDSRATRQRRVRVEIPTGSQRQRRPAFLGAFAAHDGRRSRRSLPAGGEKHKHNYINCIMQVGLKQYR